MTAKTFERTTFTVPRELEFFTKGDLSAQTGCPEELWWPDLILKEGADNALDCSEGVVAPVIAIDVGKGFIRITDNGPGIEPDVVRRILDYSSRTSAKQAYISPTRGTQGNGLKTILAIPYALSGNKNATVEIVAGGIKHRISISTDAIAQRPRITHEPEKIVKNTGTSIRLTLDSACLQNAREQDQNLQKLIHEYSLFNPHATFVQNGQRFEATNPDWKKWLPNEPIPAQWYDDEGFEYLVASKIAAERNGAKAGTVREFASQFRNLSATSKQTKVCEASGLARAYLHDLAQDGQIDRAAVSRLLNAMQAESKPVKPEALGVLGEQHFRKLLAAEGDTFRYSRRTGFDPPNLPYVVEAAFAIVREDSPLIGLHTGLNWSVPLTQPLQQVELGGEKGLSALLESTHIDFEYGMDSACLVLHLTSPRFVFLDRGKGSLKVGRAFADSITEAVLRVTNQWSKIKIREYRRQWKDEQARERLLRSRSSHVSEKIAAYEAIPAAYEKASAGKPFAEARQVMYAARPYMLARTGKSQIDDERFTQKLLPQYVREHREQVKAWSVVYDDRGHLIEPHTNKVIGLGTLNVRDYLSRARETPNPQFALPSFATLIPTVGPKYRYGGLLFVEKEGLVPLLQLERIGERYDLAIGSGKGLAPTAARDLIEGLAVDHQVRIFVVHDFDKAGFSILGTLTRDTERHQFTREFEVIDLGFRLADVKKWGLEGEPVAYLSDPTPNLVENGATQEEIRFLLGNSEFEYNRRGKSKLLSGMGRRVELNELPNDRFLAWLESKLAKHKAAKVIPGATVLEQAYRRNMTAALCQKFLADHWKEIEQQAKNMQVPKSLRRQVVERLKCKPELSWDLALNEVLSNERNDVEIPQAGSSVEGAG